VYTSQRFPPQQHIAGEVEIFVMYTQRIFLRINWRKDFENRSTFAKVIIKHQVAYFFETQCAEGHGLSATAELLVVKNLRYCYV